MTVFRCAAASRDRGDQLAGTASTVRSYLLLEHPGPWGVDALRDARLPDGLGAHLQEQSRRHRVRVLLVRRPGRRGTQVAPGSPTRVVAARAAGADSWAEATDLDRLDEVRDLDLAALGAGRSVGLEPDDAPFLAVCTHGRHDACCAAFGRPVALALAAGPHAADVWEVSHVGGDRFAGNLVVLPRGLYYGGLDPESALRVAAATARGEVLLEHFRGRSDLPMAVQFADVEVRRRLGLLGLDDVRPTSARTTDGVTTVVLDAAGTSVALEVRQVLGAEERLTCRAVRSNAVPRFEATPA